MKPTTIRLPEELLEALDEEAAEHDFHTRTEYLRYLIDHRELVISIALEQRKTRMDMLEDKVGDIEDRIEDLETPPSPGDDQTPATEAESDATQQPGDQPETATTATEAADAETTLEPLPDLEGEGPEPLELRDPGPEAIDERVESLDFFAPTREIRSEREAAVVTAWETLLEYGELTREDFTDLVFEDNPAAFSSFDGWYDRLIVAALEQLDDVERADEDTWRYIGDTTA